MTCEFDPEQIEETPHGQVVPHGGKIHWQDDDTALVTCDCGYDQDTVLGEIDNPHECDGCGCKLYVEVEVRIMRVL